MTGLSLEPLLSLFLKTPCPLCGSSSRMGQPLLCQDCQQQLQDCRWQSWQSKQQCYQKPLGHQQPWHNSPERSSLDVPLVSWGRYEGKLKQAIAQLKYRNTTVLAELLGEGLAEDWLQEQQAGRGKSRPRPWVVPVPMHPEKQRQRGFNQAELMARSFCRRTGLPLLAQGLQRIQATQAQFELSPTERQRNVAQAFAIGPDLLKQQKRRRNRQRPVLLLDDIYTTGATVGAIAQVLIAAQIPIAGVAAVAQTTAQTQIQPPASKKMPPLPRLQPLRQKPPAAGAAAMPGDRP